MISAAKDITTILTGESSLGLTYATDLFFARMPDDPSDCVVAYDNPGSPPQLTYKKATSDYFYSSVSIQVRNTSYEGAWNQMFAILNYLHAESNITVGTTLYTLIKALNEPQLLHYDDNDRPVMVVNFDIQRRDS